MVNEQAEIGGGFGPGCGLPFGGLFIWIFWLFFIWIILSVIFRPVVGRPGFGF